jgi:hypothetical protein
MKYSEFKKLTFKNLVNSLLKNPEDWTQKSHTLKHKSGLSIWTSNWLFWYSIYEPGEIKFIKFNLWEKLQLHFVIKRWRKLDLQYKTDFYRDLAAKLLEKEKNKK